MSKRTVSQTTKRDMTLRSTRLRKRALSAVKDSKKVKKKVRQVTNIAEVVKTATKGKRKGAGPKKSTKPKVSSQRKTRASSRSQQQVESNSDVNDETKNEDVCRICGQGGTLLCCDGCPAAYRLECLGLTRVPKGDWFCPSCTEAKKKKGKGRPKISRSMPVPKPQAEKRGRKKSRQAAEAVTKGDTTSKAGTVKEEFLGRKKRKAAEGVKYYSCMAPAEDIGLKDYTGYFTQERVNGKLFDGFVYHHIVDQVDAAQFRGNAGNPLEAVPNTYIVDIIGVKNDAGKQFQQEMTPFQVSNCIVPFEKLVKREIVREKGSGKRKKIVEGRITKYLGNRDESGRSYVHFFDVEYEDGTKEPLTNFQLSRCLARKQGSMQMQASQSHPYKKGESLVQNCSDKMVLTLFFYIDGNMKSQKVEVPSKASVSVLKHCIWEKTRWMDSFAPKYQLLNFGSIDLSLPEALLEEYGIDHGQLIACNLIPSSSTRESQEVIEEPMEMEVRDVIDASDVAEYRKQHLIDRDYFAKPVHKSSAGKSSAAQDGPRRAYVEWERKETECLVKGIRTSFENKLYAEKNFWKRLRATLSLEAERTPQDLRIKWRSLKNTARIPHEKRRKGQLQIPQSVLEEVLFIAENLEKPAKRGAFKKPL